jgi:hypothetical protein
MSGINYILNAAKEIDRRERDTGNKTRLNGSIGFNSDRNIIYPIGDDSELRKQNSQTLNELQKAKYIDYFSKKDYKYDYSKEPYENIHHYGNTYRNTIHNQMESSGYKGKGGKRQKKSLRKSRKSRSRKSKSRKSRK